MRLSERTRAKYTQIVRDHAGSCEARGRSCWREVTTDDVLADMGAGGCSGKTARLRLTAYRAFYPWAIREGLRDANPCDGLRMPKDDSEPPHVISEADVLAMLDSCAGDEWEDVRDRAILEAFYSTGARVSELAALKIDDLDFATGAVVIRCGKGGRSRFAMLGPSALAAVTRWVREFRAQFDGDPRERHVFLTIRRGPFTTEGLRLLVIRRARGAGVAAHVSPHVLRHSFATHLLQHDADVRTVQAFMGHTSIQSTMRYLQLDDRWLRAEHKKHHPRG